ncbi:hypothetical protein BC936DRAFT_137605 [Jimgerdemannia flammicorona]|uniref:Uncharacterized protein n=1 Tax=Jimgerdemannia flammicorona TaxID=994334 RepID=A0A433CWZ8_9FUNG|nr:hypothetical protein BC936DRAFT_137605 [Jimgerdemannia flammicorona]
MSSIELLYICGVMIISANQLAPHSAIWYWATRPISSTFLSSRATRSLITSNEAVLQGVVEFLFDKLHLRVPELRLVVNATKEYGNGRYGFVDVFIPSVMTHVEGIRTHNVVLELKYISITSRWYRLTWFNIHTTIWRAVEGAQ